MRGPVRKAIESGKYSLAVAWEKLDPEDREMLLVFVRTHTEYSNAHMGMLPLMSLTTIFMALDRTNNTIEMYYKKGQGPWVRKDPVQVDRIRTTIRLQIQRAIKLDERLARLRAKERRTA